MRSSLYDVRRETVSSIVPANRPAPASKVGDCVHWLFMTIRSRSSSIAWGSTDTMTSSDSATAFGLPGRLTISVRCRTPANARDSIAVFDARDRSRANRFGDARHFVIEDRRGRLRRRSRGASPVPPLVKIKFGGVRIAPRSISSACKRAGIVG